jgi:hypothetical protein
MTAWQAWLLLAVVGAAAVWVFLLKVRPPRVSIPSLLLWRRVLDDNRELTIWERIRRAVSLAATVLIAIALGLAILRPSQPAEATSGSGGRLLIVLDSSWSMLARTSGGETRWDRAVAQARRLAAGAAGDEMVLATTADGLVEGPTRDLALVEAALDRIAPAGGEASAWPRMADVARVHFITDGAVARPLDPGVILESVFEAAPNVAITAFTVRPAIASSVGPSEAYLEIANFSPDAQNVSLQLQRGGAVVLEREIAIQAGETIRQVMPLPSGGEPILRARIDAPANALAVDDEAVAWIEEASPLRVAVVGEQSDWIAALLRQDPGVQVSQATPAAYRAGDEDVVVFDRWAPAEPPSRPALVFAVPADTPWLAGPDSAQVGGGWPARELRPRWRPGGDHPVVQGVDPLTFRIDSARAYGAPTLEPVARSEQGLPLVSVDRSAGRRLVLVGFGPSESNLTSAPGFPILVGNALAWLGRPAAARSETAGEVVFDESVERVTAPDGGRVPIERVDEQVVAVLRTPGLYVAEGGGATTRVAVNVGNPQASNVQRTSLEPGSSSAVASGRAPSPWWAYCAMAAFALVLVEWFTWQRRITV